MVNNRSQIDRVLTAETIPVVTPMTSQMIDAPMTSDRVIGNAEAISEFTDC